MICIMQPVAVRHRPPIHPKVPDTRLHGAATEAILRHAGLWRDAPARAPLPTLRTATARDSGTTTARRCSRITY